MDFPANQNTTRTVIVAPYNLSRTMGQIFIINPF